MALDITIREHFCSTPENRVWQVIVGYRGREYRQTYAGDKPTTESVTSAFEEDRKSRLLRSWR